MILCVTALREKAITERKVGEITEGRAETLSTLIFLSSKLDSPVSKDVLHFKNLIESNAKKGEKSGKSSSEFWKMRAHLTTSISSSPRANV